MHQRNFGWCYFEEDENYLFFYFPQDIVPMSVITSILLKLHRLTTIPQQLRIGSKSRQCYGMMQLKQRAQKLRRIDVETTQKNSTWKTDQYFIDFESRIQLKISTSNRCHNFQVDSPFKIDVIPMNFPRGILTMNRWQIDKDVSIRKF